MFKKFDKVFKFTFRNQTGAGSYKATTIGVGLALFLIPVIVFFIIAQVNKGSDDEKGIEACGADKIYVVNEISSASDFNIMNQLREENYMNLTYLNEKSVEAALEQIKSRGETKSLVVHIYKDANNGVCEQTIVPEGSGIEKSDAGNLDDFFEEQNQLFTVLASGIPVEDLMKLTAPLASDVYSQEGFVTGQSIYDTDKATLDEKNNESILPGFNMILVYITVMVVYFVVLAYGSSINQNVVLEKSSKLMDTMLISLPARSLIFGKLLGVLAAAFIQFFVWIAAIVLGMFAGVKVLDIVWPENDLAVITFFKSLGELGLFKPLNVVIALIVLILGIVLYCAIAAVGGAISSTKEEAASNQSIFVILLVVCFYLILMKGMDTTDIPTWLYLFPGTGAMLLPAGICSGMIGLPVMLGGLAIMLFTTALALLLAGKLYVMMSLYKGNGVKIGKALKMLFAGDKKTGQQEKV